jgi:hypothetical protein
VNNNSLFPQRDAGERDGQAKTAEACSGSRGITAFLGEENAFLPGMEPFGHKKLSLFTEPTENKSFSKRKPVLPSTKLEMILILFS